MRSEKPLSRVPTTVALAAALALAGCDGGTGPDDRDTVSGEDAEAIAGFVSNVDFASVGVATLTTTSGTRTYGRTVSCPAGGSVSVSGSGETSRDDATRILSTKWTNTQTHAACAITHTRGDKTVTAVIDGSVTGSGTASWQLPEKRGDLPTLLSWTGTRAGSTTTTVGDRKSTCEVNLTQTWNSATKMFTISGVMCGRQVNITRDWGSRGG